MINLGSLRVGCLHRGMKRAKMILSLPVRYLYAFIRFEDEYLIVIVLQLEKGYVQGETVIISMRLDDMGDSW